MSEDTKLTELIINTLSPEQLPEVLSDTEIYLVEDDAEYATVEELATKQDTLVSGTNIKTINNESILGEGNFDVSSIEPLSQEEYDRRKEAGELDETKYYSTPSDVSLQILQAIYPVGSLYLTTTNSCPLANFFGTWQLEATDRVLQGAGSRGAVGTTINESLPNIKSSFSVRAGADAPGAWVNTIYSRGNSTASTQTSTNAQSVNFSTEASLSSSTYKDNAPVQQDAYLINVYRRIA